MQHNFETFAIKAYPNPIHIFPPRQNTVSVAFHLLDDLDAKKIILSTNTKKKLRKKKIHFSHTFSICSQQLFFVLNLVNF